MGRKFRIVVNTSRPALSAVDRPASMSGRNSCTDAVLIQGGLVGLNPDVLANEVNEER
jgi:hypothetical protein